MLTRTVFEQHWSGSELFGIYPLLKDNPSYFIAADFDKDNWQEQILAFSKICSEFELRQIIERSRLGNGGYFLKRTILPIKGEVLPLSYFVEPI